jgi:Leucine-rich repeat (LRR) protein
MFMENLSGPKQNTVNYLSWPANEDAAEDQLKWQPGEDRVPCLSLDSEKVVPNAPKVIYQDSSIKKLNFYWADQVQSIELTRLLISDLDLRHCFLLKELNVQDCPVTSIFFPEQPYIRSISIDHCPLGTFSLPNTQGLEALQLASTDLEEFSLQTSPLLTHLSLINSPISVLQLKALSNLEYLVLENIRLSALDTAAIRI